MKALRKAEIICFLGVVLCVTLMSFKMGEAVSRPETLEATGIFERLEEYVENDVLTFTIVLNVNGHEAKGPLTSECVFVDDKGNQVNREIFVRRYLKRVITVELYVSGEVVLCRVGA